MEFIAYRAARQQKPGAPPDRDKLQLLVKDLGRPNGLAFSPDEKYMYVAESVKKFWMRYKVQPDGSLTDGSVFIDCFCPIRRKACRTVCGWTPRGNM